MRKGILVSFIGVLLLSFVLSGCSSAESGSSEGEFLRVGTASMGGNFFPLGAAIAQMVNDEMDGYNASAQATGGSSENANFLGSGDLEFALIQSSPLKNAYQGKEKFDGRAVESLRGVTAIYFNSFHILVRKDAGVETIEDLKGKKIAVGPVGGGIQVNTNKLLGVYGISPEDYEAVHGTRQDATEGLKTGRVDAHIYATGIGSSQVTDLINTGEVKLISMDQATIEKMVEENPDFGEGTIPAGTYEGQDEPVETIRGSSLLVTTEDMSEDLVYELTKKIFENIETLQGHHKYFKQTKVEDATKGMSVPLHPGAKKYFEEVGTQ
ncbi:TAXI family TRAP transporter solute-binding subunit [Alkalihalobacillus sp. AL-G]|uniref:TAXI family TRAP transporter solute-binding subunit n=1 Tax=Alkalihalobacillus sp. AL-G TaxID=2926399 RepID=UPI00272D1890|nr:TAXI family TRAP transporter solute-binding subunit [Alkalihalobacillus sp. AL-G]WLD93703.1 TAXI family TRAP transporter solute-binding subunit [Alkalihalobacillus sp. AL-G]